MTANERHREDAFRIHGHRCALAGAPGHTCGGRLQAHHSISKQTLKRLHAQAVRGASMIGIRPEWEKRIAVVDLDDLIADGRNSDIVCELGHRQLELGRYTLLPHGPLRAFAADYALVHYLPTEQEAA